MVKNIYTSYFGKVAQLQREFENGELINIARVPPIWFSAMKGVRSYRILSPTWDIFNEWNMNRLTEQQYVDRFRSDVLQGLDCSMIVRDLLLGHDDAVLLCYESPEKFCHRHVVARWITAKTGLPVSELKF